jgi:ParB family chromosome partitioning protein
MSKHALNGVDGFVKRNEYFDFDPALLIVEDGFNPRLSFGDQDDIALKESIRENGVMVPLAVQKIDGKLIIREGHRRRWACMELIKEGAEIKKVPVMLKPLLHGGARPIVEHKAPIVWRH